MGPCTSAGQTISDNGAGGQFSQYNNGKILCADPAVICQRHSYKYLSCIFGNDDGGLQPRILTDQENEPLATFQYVEGGEFSATSCGTINAKISSSSIADNNNGDGGADAGGGGGVGNNEAAGDGSGGGGGG